MTVSRALRGDPALSAATVKKVRRIADEVGFRPDPKLAELMVYLRRNRTKKTHETIAFINAFPGPAEDTTPTEKRIFEGARARAAALGYQLEMFTLAPTAMPADRLARIIHTRGMRGVIFQASRGMEFDVGEFADRFATCVVGTSKPDVPLHIVCNHHTQTMSLALNRLSDLRYRRIGFYMMQCIDATMDHAWQATFLFHRHQHGTFDPGLALLQPTWDRRGFSDWFHRQKPDAIVTNHLPALEWMCATGAEVPQRTGFVHLDWSLSLSGQCAGVDQRTELVGSAAVDIVGGQLMHNEVGVPANQHTVLIKSIWRDGPTTKLQPRSRS